MEKKPNKGSPSAARRAVRRVASPEVPKQTKKQIALGRKDASQNRLVLIAVAALGVLIVAILAAGLIQELAIRPAQAVATVDGARVRLTDYQTQLTYRRYQLHNSALQLENGLQSLDPADANNEFLINFYQQQLTQTQTLLASAPETVLEQLIEDELIAAKAEEAGIRVTSADVDASINEDLRLAVSPQATEPVTGTEPATTPTPVPQDEIDRFYENVLANMQLSNRQFRSIVQRSLLRTKVEELLVSQVLTTGLVAQVQMIQTDTEDKAAAALSRIQGGEDFAVVATEIMTGTQSLPSGGQLGWVTEDQLTSRYGAEVATAAFSQQIGELSQVKGNDKFYVLLVTERDENGPLPQEVVSQKENSALTDWLEQRKASPEVKIERLLDTAQIPPDPFTGATSP